MRSIDIFYLFKAQDRASKVVTAVGGSMRKTASDVRKAEKANKEYAQSARVVSKELKILNRLFAGVGIGAGVVGIERMLDTVIQMDNQLRLVTESQDELNAVFAELRQISEDTRTPLDANIESYRRLGVATKDSNVSARELLAVQKSVNQALIISGSGAQEARAGLIQFAQGLASNRLQGDELRSVLENVPRLAQAIAAGMGTNIGQIRKLASEGKLTAAEVIKALKSQSAALEDEFNRVNPTISQSFVLIRNQILNLFREINNITGVAATVANGLIVVADAVEFLTDNIDRVIVVIGLLALTAIPRLVAAFTLLNAQIVTFISLSIGQALIGIYANVLVATAGLVGFKAVLVGIGTVVSLTPFWVVMAAGLAIATTAVILLRDDIKGIGDVLDALRVGVVKLITDIDKMFIDMVRITALGIAKVKFAINDAFNKDIFDENVIADKYSNVITNTAKAKAEADKFLADTISSIVNDSTQVPLRVTVRPEGSSELEGEASKYLEELNKQLQSTRDQVAALDLVSSGQIKNLEIAKLIVQQRKHDTEEINKATTQLTGLIQRQEELNAIIKAQDELKSINEKNEAIRSVLTGQYESLQVAELQIKANNALTEEEKKYIQQQIQSLRFQDQLQEKLALTKRLGDEIGSSFDNMFKNLINGSKGFKESLSDLAGELANLIFQLTVIEPLKKSITSGLQSGAGGTGGDFLSTISSVLIGSFKQGGISTQPKELAHVPMSAFRNAPQFAKGTGNTSGFPAILHPNEAVVPLSGGRSIPVDMGSSGGNTFNMPVNVEVTVQGGNSGGGTSNPTDNQKLAAQIGDSVRTTVYDVLNKESKPGGILAGVSSRGRI